MKKQLLSLSIAALSLPCALSAQAAGVAGVIEEVLITATGIEDTLQGDAEAASVGTVLAHQLQHRPVLRPAEVLEMIPGMVVTQHSGEGKANQYFLRGFNLDHATDFASFVEGAPVNNVSHGHGQGYTDLNFLIPELIDRMVYKKGPYYASEGDFSTAGSSRMDYVNSLQKQKLKLTLGEDNYQRFLFMGGYNRDEHSVVYAYENLGNDGPWKNEQDYQKDNAFLKYSTGDNDNGLSISGIYYDATWNSTDQIPQHLVANGTLNQFGTLDDSTGGETHRYQLSYQQWFPLSDATRVDIDAYWIDYQLSLTSNATYFSNDIPTVSPVDGVAAADINDQFTQFDDRNTFGGRFVIEHDIDAQHQLDAGMDMRFDDISNVGVGSSYQRTIYAMTSQSEVTEWSASAFTSLHSQWNSWFATILGARYDKFEADVDAEVVDGNSDAASLATASGKIDDDLLSPKASLRFGPFDDTEFFVNYGEGFHSNDGRGAVADPNVPLLSESKGYELGMRTAAIENVQLTAVLFQLELDSELVFVGDDGTTEPRDSTEREGIELGLFHQPNEWLVIDADYAYSRARFKKDQFDGATLLGDHVPDSVQDVFSLGMSVDMDNGYYGGLRFRFFGPRNLTEAGDIQSESTSVVNANAGYRFPSGLSLGLEVLNLFDSDDDDITYLYESRTQDERNNNIDPIVGLHSHPMIPRTVRASVAYEF